MSNGYQTTVYEPADNRNHIALRLLDRPIAYHRIFVELTGSVTAAVMLSQAFYWSRRTKNEAGWFYKTQQEWTDETGLTRYEQETARKKLRQHNWWQEDLRKANGSPTLHFRINTAEFYRDLVRIASENGDAQISQMDMRESNNSLDMRESNKTINRDYTEITAESGPPPAQLGQRRKRPKPAHIVTAEKFGLTPREMTDFVNAILDVTQRRELADTDTELGERELATAQTVAETLLKMGIHTPNDVHRIVQVFRSYHPDWDIMPSQLPQYATKDFKKAAPSFSEERRGVVNMKFRN